MGSVNVLEPLPWDSGFFDKSVAKIELEQVTANATLINSVIRSSDVDVVYCFVRPEEGSPEEIENLIANAEWVDGKVTFIKNVVTREQYEKDPFIVSAEKVNEQLYNLAIQTGIYSRFNTDKHFAPQSYERLYRKWLESSLDRSIADEVLVFKEENMELGLVTLGRKKDRADIGLIGVDERARGKGIAMRLLEQAEQYAAQQQFDTIQVVTQQLNIPACRLYEKYGFQVSEVINIFHVWK